VPNDWFVKLFLFIGGLCAMALMLSITAIFVMGAINILRAGGFH